jgi:phosphoribosylpyrophosphate synthetase
MWCIDDVCWFLIKYGVILSDPVKKKTVLIVDDLYQSGTSIWAYAEYLKFLGASKVFAIVSVKSLKDSDNQ